MLAEALADLPAAIAECCDEAVVKSAAVAVEEESWTTVTLARPRGRSNPENSRERTLRGHTISSDGQVELKQRTAVGVRFNGNLESPHIQAR